MKMINKHKGFTLIELMIVVAIIGILASIAIAQYGKYTARAQVADGVQLLEEAKKKIEIGLTEGITFPATANLSTLEIKTSSTYVSSLETSDTNQTLTVTFGGAGVSRFITNGTLVWDRSIDGNWMCDPSNTTLDSEFLPNSCNF